MYQFNADGSIKRLQDGLNIPAAEGSSDYRDVMAWVELGNAIAPVEVPEPTPEAHAAQKAQLLVLGGEKREAVLNRLNGHWLDALDAHAAATVAQDAAEALLQANNIAAIRVCRASLKAMFTDPRVEAAIDGEVKAAVMAVFLEIAAALYQAAPTVYVAFKGWDQL